MIIKMIKIKTCNFFAAGFFIQLKLIDIERT
jgi:hypothetical protein